MDRINEIGDTKKGQEMLGRTAERAYQRAQRTSGADKNRYMRTYNDAYKTGGKSSNKHLGGSREHFDNGRDYEYEKWADEHNGNVAESKTMNKKLIRLTESDLHKIVKESVNKIINEIGDTPKGQFMLGRAYRRAEKRGDKDTAVRASNKAWDGSEGGGRNYRNFKSGIDFQNDMDTDKAYKSLHKILNHSVKEDYNPFDNDDFEEWDRTNVSPISDEEYNEIMRMNPMQNSSYIFNKIGFNKWNGFVSRWGKENPEECERFWQSQMAF